MQSNKHVQISYLNGLYHAPSQTQSVLLPVSSTALNAALEHGLGRSIHAIHLHLQGLTLLWILTQNPTSVFNMARWYQVLGCMQLAPSFLHSSLCVCPVFSEINQYQRGFQIVLPFQQFQHMYFLG